MTMNIAETSGSNWRDTIRRSYGLMQSVAVLLLLIICMTLISPRFMSVVNIQNLMTQMAPSLIVAAGMTIVMINGSSIFQSALSWR